jgi:hypothetical protein
MILKAIFLKIQNSMFIFYMWLKAKKIINAIKTCLKIIIKKIFELKNNFLVVLLFLY